MSVGERGGKFMLDFRLGCEDLCLRPRQLRGLDLAGRSLGRVGGALGRGVADLVRPAGPGAAYALQPLGVYFLPHLQLASTWSN